MSEQTPKPDHAAALKAAKSIIERSGMRLRHKNLAAAYLELRELAKAVLEPWEPEWDTPSRKALRTALGEE